MNVAELEKKLSDLGVKKHCYSLNGGLPSETFCLNNVGKKWEVYYSEKGNKSCLKLFHSESDACVYFYEFITSDGVIKDELNL
jgi:DNA-directed RNA polymerase subunit N (RpoN/RPB10)